MGKIIITTNVTLDGVVEDPDGQEGTPHGGWFARYGGDDLGEWTTIMTGEALGAAALLLGRRSDEWFAKRWLSRDGVWADRLNSMPKYVVSSTLEAAHWSNATVVGGDLVAELGAVKEAVDGEILVYASYQLDRMLITEGLADELRLMTFPVVLGEGRRLFDGIDTPTGLHLVDARMVGDGIAFHRYELVR